MNTLYTLGYQRWSLETIATAASVRGAIVADVRYRAWSVREEFCPAALSARLGNRYWQLPELGNKNYQGGPHLLDNPEAALPLIEVALLSYPVILMCQCADADTCHRSTAARWVAERLGCTVEHLEPPMPQYAFVRRRSGCTVEPLESAMPTKKATTDSKIVPLWDHLLRRARATQQPAHSDLWKGARLVATVRDGWITCTIARVEKKVGDTELGVFRRDCAIPFEARRSPAEGQMTKLFQGQTWHCVVYQWEEEPLFPNREPEGVTADGE
jgi:hypothetical protein